ncbi:MAG: hypothetical protein OET44_01465 [Gammaproteobacteria bacterium]|nr:hypothetical protein [Gammaproteobacteria bacterium]
MIYIKKSHARNRALTAFACIVGFAFTLSGCGGSSSTPAPAAPPAAPGNIAISGKIETPTAVFGDVAEPDVTVEAVYTDPGDPANPTAMTDANGDYSIAVEQNRTFYLRFSKDTFATLNSEKVAFSNNQTGIDQTILLTGSTQIIINDAFAPQFPQPGLPDFAWLAVGVEDNDVEINGVTISSVPATFDRVYTDCTGADSGQMATSGAVCPGRGNLGAAPQYIAYFVNITGTVEADVTADGVTKKVPLRVGEIAVVEF